MAGKRFKGWIIARKYRYKSEDRYDPIGKVNSDGSTSGYIYIYPTQACAILDMYKIKSNFKGLAVIKAEMFINKS